MVFVLWQISSFNQHSGNKACQRSTEWILHSYMSAYILEIKVSIIKWTNLAVIEMFLSTTFPINPHMHAHMYKCYSRVSSLFYSLQLYKKIIDLKPMKIYTFRH